MPKYNLDIRAAIQASGFKYYLVADQAGISDTTLSKWLRKEMSPEKKKKIFEAINQLKEQFHE